MLNAGDVLDLAPIGMKLFVTRSSAQSGGRSFEMEMELQPGTGGTPVHVHPQATETYRVLHGTLDVYVNGQWTSLSAGEEIAVEPGIPHTFRNSGGDVARVYNTHQPALRYEEFFHGLHGVANSGAIREGRMTFRALLHLAVLWTSFRDEIRAVRPPHALMRGLGAVGRWLGYRAG